MNKLIIIFSFILTLLFLVPSMGYSQMSGQPVTNCEKYYEESLFKQEFSLPLKRKVATKTTYILEIFEDKEGRKVQKILLFRTKKTDELFNYIIEKDLISKGNGDRYISVARFDKNGGIEVKRFTELCN